MVAVACLVGVLLLLLVLLDRRELVDKVQQLRSDFCVGISLVLSTINVEVEQRDQERDEEVEEQAGEGSGRGLCLFVERELSAEVGERLHCWVLSRCSCCFVARFCLLIVILVRFFC